MNTLHGFIYVSRIAPQSSPACIAKILYTSRSRNQRSGVTGLLVFDGWKFCQYLEGQASELDDVASRIALDRRHFGVSVIYRGPITLERRFGGRNLAFAMAENEGALTMLENLHGAAALCAFDALLPTLDMGPD